MKMRILSIIPYVVFACVLFLKFTAGTSPLDVIADWVSGMISTQDTPFNLLPAFLPLALPFILLIFILFVKRTITTKIFVNKSVRYPLYLIGMGFLIYFVISILSLLLADPTDWRAYLFLAIGLICLIFLSLLRQLNLSEAEYVLYFLMLCYIPNTALCVVAFIVDGGLNIGGYLALISVLYFIAEIARIVWHHRKNVHQIAAA